MNDYKGIDERITKNVRICARKIKRISHEDIDDLEQELMLKVLNGLQKFDLNFGSFEHFLRKILSCISKNIIKRRVHKFVPLKSEPIELETRTFYCDFDFDTAIENFPYKYKLIAKLLKHYSIVDIAKTLGLSRATIHRDLIFIRNFFKARNLSYEETQFYLGSKFRMKNLSVIETLDVKDLSKLPVFDLADLNEQVAKLVSHTKELKEKLEDALNLRFSETVQNNLRSENKDTGTAKFFENGFQITTEVPKKVTWDSEKISEIIKNIPEEKCKAIVKTVHTIEERKYTQLSPEDKQLFADARTVTPGKTRFQISIPEDQPDVGSVNF